MGWLEWTRFLLVHKLNQTTLNLHKSCVIYSKAISLNSPILPLKCPSALRVTVKTQTNFPFVIWGTLTFVQCTLHIVKCIVILGRALSFSNQSKLLKSIIGPLCVVMHLGECIANCKKYMHTLCSCWWPLTLHQCTGSFWAQSVVVLVFPIPTC